MVNIKSDIKSNTLFKSTAILILCILFSVGALIFLSSCSSQVSKEGGQADSVSIEQAKNNYLKQENVTQLACVRCTEGSNAVFDYYIKQNNEWKLNFSCDAYIGKNGAGKAKEGDSKTPLGDFPIGDAFGILPNPGTKLNYIDVTNTTFACDEEGPYYNQIIDTQKTNHDCKGEDMSKISPQYNYGLQIKYNPDNVYPEGSAIFLHCIGENPYTGGCVAISQDNMQTLLKLADPSMHIIISNN